MTRRVWIMLSVAGLLCGALAGPARADERDELKERFKKRLVDLVKLQDAGKVGETSVGTVEAVKPQYLDDKVDPSDSDSPTITRFLQAENKDRLRLYQLLAEDLKTEPEKVARRDAQRRFEKAKPDHYLKLDSGKWVQKKDLEKDS